MGDCHSFIAPADRDQLSAGGGESRDPGHCADCQPVRRQRVCVHCGLFDGYNAFGNLLVEHHGHIDTRAERDG